MAGKLMNQRNATQQLRPSALCLLLNNTRAVYHVLTNEYRSMYNVYIMYI